MRRAVTTLLLAIAMVSPLAAQSTATSAPTTRYSRLYVFGDSYSDIGAGYIDGNGPTAVAYLGWLMGLQVASSKVPNAGGKSLVFAVSGAGTGEGTGRQVKDALLGYGMINQVRDFAARVKSGEIRFDPQTTLFFLAGGLNDGRRETAVTLDNLRQQLKVLRELGARHVTIAQLPTKIPQFAAVGPRLNRAYEQFVRDEAAPGLDLWLNHWGTAFDDVIQRPSAHGIVDTTSACAGRAIFDQDSTPVGDPATYFFYHEGHPSTAVHRIVGKKLFEEIAARTVTPRKGLEFIDTGFENASPLWYDVDGEVIRINLLYDHERSSPNRAAGHIHFLLHAQPGSKLTLEFRNLDNVWNGQPGSVAGELKTVAISEDGRVWRTVATESLPGNRVQLKLEMRGPKLYVARTEPYRLSDLDRLLASIRGNRSVAISSIGRTVAGRDLEMIRIGDPAAPYRVFVRARAHPWESGSSWVAQGLIQQLLKPDENARKFLKVFNVSILPMANKDGVARGGTRFNLNGKDLNRNWDAPADPQLAPENAALEQWLEGTIAAGRRPHLAIELHNDGSGRLHISRPPVPQLDRHLARMAIFEELLRKHTWFTEGSTNAAFRNSGTLGDGWLQRYGIDAVVHEFNVNWIAGLKDYPSAAHWITYGEKLADVFHDYFVRVKP